MITFSRRESMRPLLIGLLLSAPCAVANAQAPEPQPQMVIQQGHAAYPGLLAFTSDAKYLATADGSGVTKIWDTASGDLIQTIDKATRDTLSLAFSPDGASLAIGRNKNVEIWDWRRAKSLKVLGPTYSTSVGLTWATNGRFLAACDGRAYIWDVAAASLVRTLSSKDKFDIKSLAFSSDGRRVATNGNSLRLWNFKTGTLERVLSWEGARSIAFLPDGKTLASARDFNIWRWRLSDGKLLRLPPDNMSRESDAHPVDRAPEGPVLLSVDGRAAIGSSKNKEVAVFDVATGKMLRQLKMRREWIESSLPSEGVELSPDASLLAVRIESVKAVPDVEIWDFKTGQPRISLPSAFHITNVPALSDDGVRLVADIGTGIGIWKLDSNIQNHFVSVGGNQGRLLRLNRDGKTLYRQGWDRAGGQWLETFDLTAEMPVAKITPLPPKFSVSLRLVEQATAADGEQIWATQEKKSGIYSLKSGQFSPLFIKPEYALHAVAPSGELVALFSQGQLHLWNPRTDTMNTLPGEYPKGVMDVAFSPDGRLVGARSYDTLMVTLWDVATHQRVRQLPSTGAIYGTYIFSPDSSRIAARQNGKVVVWNITTGAEELSFPANSDTQITFSGSGKTLLLSTPGGVTKFLEISSGKLRATLQLLIPVPKMGKPNPQPEWILYTPEGYYEASIRGAHAIRWNVDGELSPWDKYASRFHRPDIVLSALREG